MIRRHWAAAKIGWRMYRLWLVRFSTAADVYSWIEADTRLSRLHREDDEPESPVSGGPGSMFNEDGSFRAIEATDYPPEEKRRG